MLVAPTFLTGGAGRSIAQHMITNSNDTIHLGDLCSDSLLADIHILTFHLDDSLTISKGYDNDKLKSWDSRGSS